MMMRGEVLQLSASDLVGHLNCRHLTELERQASQGNLSRPQFHDPFLELLLQRGAIHEAKYVDHLTSGGLEVIRIEGLGIAPAQVEATLVAMKSGVPLIVQGALANGAWAGRTDILRRISEPSALGDWSYEIIDTKLAQQTRGGTVLQLCLYSDLLSSVQGHWPEYVYVVVPGSDFPAQRYRTSLRDFLDWARLISCNWDHLEWSPAEPQATILTVSISSRQACVL